MPPEEPADQAGKQELEQRLKEHRLQNRFHQAAGQAKKRLQKAQTSQAAESKPSKPSAQIWRTTGYCCRSGGCDGEGFATGMVATAGLPIGTNRSIRPPSPFEITWTSWGAHGSCGCVPAMK
jgi:hypothetical protein